MQTFLIYLIGTIIGILIGMLLGISEDFINIHCSKYQISDYYMTTIHPNILWLGGLGGAVLGLYLANWFRKETQKK